MYPHNGSEERIFFQNRTLSWFKLYHKPADNFQAGSGAMVTAPRRLPSTSQFGENENRFASPSFDSLSLKGRIKCNKMATGSVLQQSTVHPVCTMLLIVWKGYLHSMTNWHTQKNNILPIVITRTYLSQFWHMVTYISLCRLGFATGYVICDYCRFVYRATCIAIIILLRLTVFAAVIWKLAA